MRNKAPPAYYYDTSPDTTTAAGSSATNDALTISSTANTVGADSNASSPPHEPDYTSGYSGRSLQPQQLQTQRLIFPPPPPAPPPPPIFPPTLSAGANGRLYICGNNNNNNNNCNNNNTYGESNRSCDESAYQCTDALAYGSNHRHAAHYYHHAHSHSSLTHTDPHTHHYSTAPDGSSGGCVPLMSPLCQKGVSTAHGDFALLGKCSPSTSATTTSNGALRTKTRGCRASSRSSNGALDAMFRAAPKTALFAAVSFVLLVVALIFLLLQQNRDCGMPYLYDNELNGLLYESCGADNNRAENLPSAVPLPRVIHVGEIVYADLPPRRIIYTELVLQQSAHVVLNLSVLPHARLVVYGRQTLAPTPAQHAFQQIITADRLHVAGTRQTSASSTQMLSSPSAQKVLKYALVAQFLSAGRWFFGFLNDHHKATPISITVVMTPTALRDAKIRLDYDGSSESVVQTPAERAGESMLALYGEEEETTNDGACRFDCFGKGVCMSGRCRCHPGYSGKYCEQTACPVLCSGNGIFANGVCVCHEGFKGAECDTVANWCSVPDCNSHGVCGSDGRCQCDAGWDGEFCEKRACQPSPNCSGHGICREGRCYCADSRWGDACERLVGDVCNTTGSAALFGISLSSSTTKLTQRSLCDELICIHGSCQENGSRAVCICEQNWRGVSCATPTEVKIPRCLPGCERNGVCRASRHRRAHHHRRATQLTDTGRVHSIAEDTDEVNATVGDEIGVCECFAGWTGANCLVPACGRYSCGGGGECRSFTTTNANESINGWTCACDAQHFGDYCQFQRELFCDDGIDNDGDGLKDCEDSWECCGHAACVSSPLCLSALAPQASKNVSANASFMDRYRFLFDASGGAETTQRYADVNNFDKQRVSVLRGRVLSRSGGPLTGVRVSDARNAHYGFTITRGANDGTIGDEHGVFDLAVNGGETIELLFLRQPYPGVKRSFVIGINELIDVGDIYLDETSNAKTETSKTCRQNLKQAQQKLERDQTATVVISSSQDSMSLVNITLLGDNVPTALRVVHVELHVAGNSKIESLSAQPRLKHAFSWNRRDVYGSVNYSKTAAKIRIGYEYDGEELCNSSAETPQVIWRELSATFKSLSH